uniref:hypothetical protein n=1 Tax=Acetatifactor sp. TaxID=1872090 RepID=UPI004056FDBB
MIAEGAAFLPQLMLRERIAKKHYISITPIKEFQIEHYRKREWLPFILEGCSDKEKAFENWMNRDALFAEAVRRQCEEIGYVSLVTDGTISIDKMFDTVCKHFGLE